MGFVSPRQYMVRVDEWSVGESHDDKSDATHGFLDERQLETRDYNGFTRGILALQVVLLNFVFTSPKIRRRALCSAVDSMVLYSRPIIVGVRRSAHERELCPEMQNAQRTTVSSLATLRIMSRRCYTFIMGFLICLRQSRLWQGRSNIRGFPPCYSTALDMAVV